MLFRSPFAKGGSCLDTFKKYTVKAHYNDAYENGVGFKNPSNVDEKGEFPILGVCLGHQAICEVFGAKICHAKQLMHGKQSVVTIDNENPIFMGLDKQIPVARYHSLIADLASMPDELQVIAKDENDEVMAVCHKKYPVYGLQFHPESILTPQGKIGRAHV